MAGFVNFLKIDLGCLVLPEAFAGGLVQREGDEPALSQAGEENTLGGKCRRGEPRANVGFPYEIFFGWLEGGLAVLGQAGPVGTSVLVPVGGVRLAKRDGEQDRCEK